MNKTNKQNLQVELEDNNLRIDFLIAKKVENLSRSKVKDAILNNRGFKWINYNDPLNFLQR